MKSQRSILLPVLLALSLSCGCASSRSDAAGGAGRVEHDGPIAPIVEAANTPTTIGKLLTDLDNSIRAWNNLFLAAQSSEDRRKTRLLEENIMMLAHNRRADLIEQLEAGPLNNRVVAAAALGFTKDAEAHSPLLAALDDANESVVASALMGLWLLGRSDTPPERICPHVTGGRNEELRTNAALCLASLVQAGARADCVLPAARLGLLDAAPFVRAHCALILGILLDGDSLQALSDRLQDDKPLVCGAAARALAHMGLSDPQLRGGAARALVQAWTKLKEPAKGLVFRAQVELSGVHYGNDEKEWIQWAARLP